MRVLVIWVGLLGLGWAQADWPSVQQQALEHRAARRGPEAVALLEGAVTRWPSNGEAHYELGDAWLAAAWEAGGGASPEGTAALERAARHLAQASTLPGPHQPLATAKLVSAYDDDGLNKPAEVERLARQLARADPSSVVWPLKVARSQVAQGRCTEAADTLVQARPHVASDSHLLLGMTMVDLKVRCMDLPDAHTRALAQAALEIGTTAVRDMPAERDAYMLQSGAAIMLAPLLPEGPERDRVEALGTAAFDQFRALNPTRQRAFAGEPPDDLYALFSYLREFEVDGHVEEARRLFARAEQVHGQSLEFWRQAATHSLLTTKRLDEALRAVDRALALDPSQGFDMLTKAQVLDAMAEATSDPARRRELTAEAARWRAQGENALPVPPPPPPPPPPPAASHPPEGSFPSSVLPS